MSNSARQLLTDGRERPYWDYFTIKQCTIADEAGIGPARSQGPYGNIAKKPYVMHTTQPVPAHPF